MPKIVLLAGQSNMAGAGVSAELPDAYQSAPAGIRLFEDGEFRALIWRETFGPEVGFAHAVANAGITDVVLCKHARGGANLFYDWNPDGVSKDEEKDEYRGPLYPQLLAALTQLCEEFEDDEIDVAGVLWVQGERDSVFSFMAHAYEDNLAGLLAALRQDTGTAELPFVLGRVSPRMVNLSSLRHQHAYRTIVRDAQVYVTVQDPYAGWVDTDDLPTGDNLHYTTPGQLLLGRRLAAVWLALRSQAGGQP